MSTPEPNTNLPDLPDSIRETVVRQVESDPSIDFAHLDVVVHERIRAMRIVLAKAHGQPDLVAALLRQTANDIASSKAGS